MEDINWYKVSECAKWLSRNPDSFICMPKGLGYTMAMRKCEAFRKFIEEMVENELEEREDNND